MVKWKLFALEISLLQWLEHAQIIFKVIKCNFQPIFSGTSGCIMYVFVNACTAVADTRGAKGGVWPPNNIYWNFSFEK